MVPDIRYNNRSLETLPTSIPSSEGLDDFAHQPFIISNEEQPTKTTEVLKTRPGDGNTVMGVSGFCLLDITARRIEANNKINHIIITDRSLRVEHFWEKAANIIKTNDTQAETYLKIVELIKNNHKKYFGNNPAIPPSDQDKESENEATKEILRISAAIANKNSWLSNNNAYEKIKKIFKENNFAFLRFDLTDVNVFNNLKDQLTQRQLTLDTFYASNVVEYLQNEKELSSLAESLDGLIGPKTLYIDTRPRNIFTNDPLIQRIRVLNRSPANNLVRMSDLWGGLQFKLRQKTHESNNKTPPTKEDKKIKDPLQHN